jgi:hypothetical protein
MAAVLIDLYTNVENKNEAIANNAGKYGEFFYQLTSEYILRVKKALYLINNR